MRIFALAILLVLAMAAPAAASFGDNSVLAFSSPGDFVGKGFPRLYTDSNASLALSGSSAEVTVQAVGNDFNSFNMTFAARQGATLKPGTYKDVVRATAQNPNRPRMDISSNGDGCNVVTGSFEVKDIATDPLTGALQRVQILYEQHCEGVQAALYGEVRFGEPPTAAAAVTPSELRLPDTTFGAATNMGGVALLVTRDMDIDGVSITGPNAEDFSQRFVTCSGTCPGGPFSAGDTTSVGITYAPRKVGKSSATLRILDTNGDTYTVPLRGSTSR